MNKLLSNKKLLIIHLVIVLIFCAVFSLLVYQSYSLGRVIKNKEEIIKQKNEELINKEEEVQLCFQDSAKAEEGPKTTYKFEDFGIYSPLFEDKEVENIIYTYNGKIIKERRIDLKEEGDESLYLLGVVAWEFSSVRGGTPSSASEEGLVIFQGYENYANRPTSLDIIQSEWKGEYQTKNIGRMDYSFDFGPKEIIAVNLETYLQNSPSGHPVFVRLWYGNLLTQSENAPIILEAKEKLKEIAETLSFTP